MVNISSVCEGCKPAQWCDDTEGAALFLKHVCQILSLGDEAAEPLLRGELQSTTNLYSLSETGMTLSATPKHLNLDAILDTYQTRENVIDHARKVYERNNILYGDPMGIYVARIALADERIALAQAIRSRVVDGCKSGLQTHHYMTHPRDTYTLCGASIPLSAYRAMKTISGLNAEYQAVRSEMENSGVESHAFPDFEMQHGL